MFAPFAEEEMGKRKTTPSAPKKPAPNAVMQDVRRLADETGVTWVEWPNFAKRTLLDFRDLLLSVDGNIKQVGCLADRLTLYEETLPQLADAIDQAIAGVEELHPEDLVTPEEAFA